MKYDEDLLVELIADAELTHTEIAERVGISRRTVWLIANGRSRPDLQQQIADTVQGYRQAAIRTAAKYMQPILMKQIEVALEGEGETSRKAREFLLKNFMTILADQPAQAVEKRRNQLNEKRLNQADQEYEKNLADEREVAQALQREFECDYEDEYEYESEATEDSPTHPPAAVGATGRSPKPGAPKPHPAEPATAQSPLPAPETDHPTKAELTEFFDNLDTATPNPYQGGDPIIAYRKQLRAASLDAIASATE